MDLPVVRLGHAARRRPGRRAGFSLLELLVVMAIIGIMSSVVMYAMTRPTALGTVKKETQQLGLRVARALAWSRESGKRIVILPSRGGYVIAAEPDSGAPTMSDVNALGPGLNDEGRVGSALSVNSSVSIKDALYGTAISRVTCGPDGRCSLSGPFGARIEVRQGAIVGRVYLNQRGRVRVAPPTSATP